MRAECSVAELTGVQTFDDGGGVDEVSSAQDTHEVRVELGDLYPGGAVHVGQEARVILRAERQ